MGTDEYITSPNFTAFGINNMILNFYPKGKTNLPPLKEPPFPVRPLTPQRSFILIFCEFA